MNTFAGILRHARQESFAAGLRAGDYALRAQLARRDTEVHQLRIRVAQLQADLDNAKRRPTQRTEKEQTVD